MNCGKAEGDKAGVRARGGEKRRRRRRVGGGVREGAEWHGLEGV